MKNKKEKILEAVKDSMADLLYYNRKEDEELPINAIEDAIIEGEIAPREIFDVVVVSLKDSVVERIKERNPESKDKGLKEEKCVD